MRDYLQIKEIIPEDQKKKEKEAECRGKKQGLYSQMGFSSISSWVGLCMSHFLPRSVSSHVKWQPHCLPGRALKKIKLKTNGLGFPSSSSG